MARGESMGIIKLTVLELGEGMDEAERKRFATKAVGDLMKEL